MEISCRVIQHCIKKRLQWSSCFARKVCKENEYYEDMMPYLRKNLAVCDVQNVCLTPTEIAYQLSNSMLQNHTCICSYLRDQKLNFDDRIFGQKIEVYYA